MQDTYSLLKKIIDPLIYLFIFIFFLNLPTDPDLGWHLKNGEYFFKTGQILRDNIFSTMMPNYHWVNHSWLQDLVVYQVFSNFGFFGITILGSIIVTLTFFILSKAFKMTQWQKVITFPILAFIVQNVNLVSYRTQLISYLLTAVLFYIISLYSRHPKKILWTIPLFIVWANLHGGFILGLAVMAGYLFISKMLELFEKRNLRDLIKNSKYELISVFVILFAVLLNPFGYGVYQESFNHFGNPWIKYIAEWAPFENLSSQWWNLIIFMNLYLVSILILFFSGKLKKNASLSILILLLIFLSLYERRYAWSMYYISFPLLSQVSEFFKPKSSSVRITVSFVIAVVLLVYSVNLKSPINKYITMDWNTFCQNTANLCSPEAIEFVEKEGLTSNLSTPYSWGGWMIWNYPDIKPSIDGRMHLWEDENGYSAFAEYYTNVQDWESIDESKYNNVVVLKQKPMYDRLKRLSKEGKWKLLYEDDVSAIFQRI